MLLKIIVFSYMNTRLRSRHFLIEWIVQSVAVFAPPLPRNNNIYKKHET